MRVRHRLALFWALLALAFGWAAAARAIYVFPAGFEIKWLRHLNIHFQPGPSDALIAAILLAATWAAWTGAGRRAAAAAGRWAPRAGPWVFALLAFYAAWPVLPPATSTGLAFYGCALAAAAAVGFLLRRAEDRAPVRRGAQAALRWIGRRGVGFWTLAALAFLLAMHGYVFGGKPGFGDSVSQLFQGLILASGHLKWPAWEYPLFFSGPGIIVEDGWYSQFPPGHCLVLAVGWLLHAPWAMGPGLGALSVALVWDCGRLLYGARGGALAAAFFAFNLWWPLMSASFMNHSSTLFWLALSLDLGIRAARRPGIPAAFGAGFALGWAAATRPLTALAFGAPAIAAWIWGWRRGKAPGGRQLAAGAAGFALWVALFMAYNWGTTGDPLLTPYSRLCGALVVPGFHAANRHTPVKGLEQTATNLAAYRAWAPVAAPGLFLPLIWTLLFAALGWREALLLAQWGFMGTIYFIYYWQDLALGPRYLYESIVPYSLLAAGGLLGAVARLERHLNSAARSPAGLDRTAVWLAAGLCLASGAAAFPTIQRYHYRFRPQREWVAELGKRFADPRCVVFINDPVLDKAFVETARHLQGPLFLDHVGDEWNRRFMQAHPERRYYFLDSQGCWPYDEAPEKNLRAPKEVNWHPHTRAPEEIAALFHNPAGRPLPPPGATRH